MITEQYELERFTDPCGLLKYPFIDWLRYLKTRKARDGKLIYLTDKTNPQRNGWYIVLN